MAVIGLFGAWIVLLVSMIIPVHVLPAMILVVYALLPIGAISVGPFASFPAVGMLFLIWFLRRGLSARLDHNLGSDGRRSAGLFFVGLMFLGWCGISIFLSEYRLNSMSWVVSVLVGIGPGLMVNQPWREAELLKKTWICLGAVFGTYASIEGALRNNFIYGPLNALFGQESTQHWSVYRAEGSFGHPLALSTFLAIALSLAVAMGAQRWTPTLAVVASLTVAGLVATASRGGLVAAGVGVLIGVLMTLAAVDRTKQSRVLMTLGVVGAAAALVLQSALIQARGESVEATRSSAARVQVTEQAMQTLRQSNWVGTGGGTSSRVIMEAGSPVPLENSALQLLVSLGVPGAVLMAVILWILFTKGAINRDGAGVGALVALCVAYLGYNAFDDKPSMHIVIGLVFLMLNGSTQQSCRVLIIGTNTLAGRLTDGSSKERA